MSAVAGHTNTQGWRGSSAFLLTVLVLVNTINWADRQVVPIMFASIRSELALSDTQLGIIGGFSFSIIYALSSFVFGYLTDRRSRRNIMAFGLLCFSLATASGTLATGFWSLFAARFFTGIGEASLYPCAMSLLADRFPAERRGRAIGLFGSAAAIGGGLGVGLGGRLVDLIGWRDVFLAYGSAGLVLVPLVLLLIEPARPVDDGEVEMPPVQAIKTALGDTRLLWIWASGALVIAAAAGWAAWLPSYFQRDLGFDATKAGLVFGAAQLVGGVGGSLLGGRLGDMRRARVYAGQLDVSAVAGLVAMPLLTLVLLQGLPMGVLVFGCVFGCMAFYAFLPNLQTAVAEIVPPKRLGVTFALHAFFLAGIGSALGPFAIGRVSDLTGNLRLGLFLPLIAIVFATVGVIVAGRVMRRTPGFGSPRGRA